MKGDQPTVSTKNNKVVVTSLREVAIGNVYFDINEDQGGSFISQVEAALKDWGPKSIPNWVDNKH